MHILFTILFITLAALCKAFADTLDHHFDTSIFRLLPRKYFDPNITRKTGPVIFSYPVDAWHIANSVQICSWLALTMIYKPVLPHWWMDFAAAGILFNVVFNLFYNRIFR